MAAFTDQLQRFDEQLEVWVPLRLRGPDAPLPDLPQARSLQTLHTQIYVLGSDLSFKERVAACRGASAALQRAGRVPDIDSMSVGFIVNLPRFNSMRALSGRNRVSERLGALAAWKWIDLLDACTCSGGPGANQSAIDDLLATVSSLIFEALVSMSGELATLSDEAHQAEAAALRRRLSQMAHAGKRVRHEPVRRLLVQHALELRRRADLRGERLLRADAVRDALHRFGGNLKMPTARTLHEWLSAEGWTRKAPTSKPK